MRRLFLLVLLHRHIPRIRSLAAGGQHDLHNLRPAGGQFRRDHYRELIQARLHSLRTRIQNGCADAAHSRTDIAAGRAEPGPIRDQVDPLGGKRSALSFQGSASNRLAMPFRSVLYLAPAPGCVLICHHRRYG